MTDESEARIKVIPENFVSGVNVAGWHFRTIFLIEGILLAILTFCLTLLLLKSIGYTEISRIIGICLVPSLCSLIYGILGINDEPITTFVRNYFGFVRNQRVAFYNSRVKIESLPLNHKSYENEEDFSSKRKNVLLSLIMKNKDMQKKEENKNEEEISFNRHTMIFEDDVAAVEYFLERESKRKKKNGKDRK